MPKMFNKKWIQGQKNRLLREKMFLLHRVRSIEEIQIDREEIVESIDQAQVCSIQNLDMGLNDVALGRLQEIERALEKIEGGSYGVCEESGEMIEMKRLEKIPWARYSCEIQEELERERMGGALKDPFPLAS